MTEPKLAYIWHMYHNQLATAIFYSRPIQKRREVIKERKPASEHKPRLRLLKRIKGKIPAYITKKVLTDYVGGMRFNFNSQKSIIALHKKECKNCPWDGYSIFPMAEVDRK